MLRFPKQFVTSSHSYLALLLAGLLFWVLAPFAAAQNAVQRIGQFTDWQAFLLNTDSGGKVCMMVTIPKQSEGSYEPGSRKDVYWMVTHNSSDNAYDVNRFESGFILKADSQGRATVGSSSFPIYPEGDNGWLSNSDDAKLVQAMIRGADMVVTSTNEGGSKITDVFSLRGFTAAHNAINSACGRS